MSRYHYLKCETEYYQAIRNNEKTFEVRKNDRDFKIYECIQLNEVVEGVPTGRSAGPYEITFILYGPLYGIEEGYCVMSIRSVHDKH